MRDDERVWFVTGCGSGIGLGVARAALDAGHLVVAGVHRSKPPDDLTRAANGRLLVRRLDVTDATETQAAMEDAHRRFGHVDVLVNNAGYGYRAAVEESDRDEVESLFDTNLFGPARLMNMVLPEMRARHSGTIVNVSSIGGVRAAVGNAYYSASKAALEMVSDGLRKELDGLGVRVMIVEPGAFRTSFYDSLVGSGSRIEDYDRVMSAMRVSGDSLTPHDQPGDPLAAGRAIVRVVDSGEELPVRLALGRMAYDVLSSEYRGRLEELERWSGVTNGVDYE